VDAKAFLDHLRQSRLLTADQLAPALDRYGEEGPSGPVADFLVGAGLLTPFQVRYLLEGKGEELVLGQYRLLDEIGQGGMGKVFKAHHAVMDRIVAVKVLAPDLDPQPHARTWFDREVRLVTQLHHPNIVMAYDANVVGGRRFLVMEYVEGENLDSLVRRQGPLPIGHACELIRQVALGLQFAHEKGMVHRDIKPANLLIPAPARDEAVTRCLEMAAETGRPTSPLVKITDFGLARRITPTGDTIQLRQPGTFLGTPDYASPEQCRDVHAVDIRSDLYSLGCAFHYILTGRPPFHDTTAVEKLVRHLTAPPPAIEELRPDVPRGMAAIITRLMAKNPDDRFQTPLELARELAPWCGMPSPGMTAPPPSAPAEAISPPTRAVAYLREDAPSTPSHITQATAESTSPLMQSQGQSELPAPPKECPDTPIEADWPATEMLLVRAVELALKEKAKAETTPEAPQVPELTRVEEDSPAGPAADEPEITPALRSHWRRWTDLIREMAVERASEGWTEASYQAFHERLLVTCRQQAERGSGDRRVFFQRLESLVAPWVSLAILEQTDPDILNSLLARCRRAETLLGVRRGGELLWLVGLAVGVVAAVVLVGRLWFR
jgi:serine/threonine-protein kinase